MMPCKHRCSCCVSQRQLGGVLSGQFQQVSGSSRIGFFSVPSGLYARVEPGRSSRAKTTRVPAYAPYGSQLGPIWACWLGKRHRVMTGTVGKTPPWLCKIWKSADAKKRYSMYSLTMFYWIFLNFTEFKKYLKNHTKLLKSMQNGDTFWCQFIWQYTAIRGRFHLTSVTCVS